MVRSLLAFLCFFLGTTQAYSVLGDEFEEIEHLWLTQNVHISAEYLCQDGVYVYFKNEEACSMATPAMSCVHSKKISPINFIERVELPDGGAVTHFYSIKTAYQYSRYELSDSGPIKSYDLVESKQIPLPVCAGMIKKKPAKVRKVRKAMKSELAFMQGMVDSGVSIVNSPYGLFDPDSLLEIEKEQNIGMRPRVKSPLCSKKLNPKDLVTQASTEWTGNGVIKVEALNTWQKESTELFIYRFKDQDDETKYEFVCLDEVKNA